MFTLCDESARCVFLDILLAAKDVAPVIILLTLRADFMGQAQSFSSAFSQLLDESIVSSSSRPLLNSLDVISPRLPTSSSRPDQHPT
jgi:hypothetical protein